MSPSPVTVKLALGCYGFRLGGDWSARGTGIAYDDVGNITCGATMASSPYAVAHGATCPELRILSIKLRILSLRLAASI